MASSQEFFINPITLFIFVFLFTNGIIISIPVDATSTLRLGDQLNSTDSTTLLSQDGNFTLGFFTIDATNYTYLGIWYTNDDLARKVWLANRDAPIVANSGLLSIDNTTGKLILTSEGRTIMSIPDQGRPGANLSAILEDSGNFVLRDENENRVLWQSFDYPTDVLLPGMKLGYSLTNGRNWTLTSWLSDNILPASGSFSLSWEPNEESRRLMIRRRGQPYWTSGSLENQTFEFISGLNDGPFSSFNYNLSYVDNRQEKYFSFESIDGSTPMWILRADGKININGANSVFWETEDFCYGYETKYGCVGNSVLPPCRGTNDMFRPKRGDFAPSQISTKYIDNSSLSFGDCMYTCWKECDCVGFITSGNGTSCLMWTGSNEFRIDEQGNAVLKYVLSPRKSRKSKSASL